MAKTAASVTVAFDLQSNAKQVGESSAQAIDRLQKTVAEGTDKLRGMQQALARLKGTTLQNSTVAAQLKTQIGAQKAALATATGALVQMGGPLKATSRDSGELVQKLAALTARFDGSGAGLMKLARGIGGLRALGPVALFAGIAAAAIGVATGILVATAALLKWGLAAADARRSELIQLEGLTKLRTAWMLYAGVQGLAADKADFLQGAIDEVSNSVALSRDRVAELTTQIYKMGLRGGNLQAALKGAATVASVQGDAAAQSWLGWAQATSLLGGSVKGMAADVESRLGRLREQQLLGLDVQLQKLHENLGKLFDPSKMHLEGFLSGLHKVLELFNLNTASGKALQALLGSLFGGLGDRADAAGLVARRALQGVIIATLYVGIGFQKLRIALKSIWPSEFISTTMLIKSAMALAGTMVVGLTVALAVFAGVAAAAVAAGDAIYQVIAGFADIVESINALGWEQTGINAMKGIADGVLAGAKWVWDAIKYVANDIVLKGFKDMLHIKSPSLVMARMAINVPRGVAVGIRAGAPEVHQAARHQAREIPEAFRAVPFAAAQVSAGIGVRANAAAGMSVGAGMGQQPRAPVTVGDVIIHTRATDAKGIAADVRAALRAEFEAMGIHVGSIQPAVA